MNKFKLLYRSQLEYGKYGSNICTPVCCVVGSNYLLDNIGTMFTPEKMDSIMKTCHSMYAECFARSGVNMMLSEVQTYFPSSVKFLEIAGMTHRDVSSSEDVEELLIQPLYQLLTRELEKKGSKRAIIITRLEHTVCYLLDEEGHIMWFDPLEACIQDVTCTWKQTIPEKNIEYSGLILSKNS